MKRSIVATILAATVLVSMVGMASANVWHLDNDNVMYQEAGHMESGNVTIDAGNSSVWRANNSAIPDDGVHFDGDMWFTLLVTGDGDQCNVSIGHCNGAMSNFTKCVECTNLNTPGIISAHFNLGDGFTVPHGKYLALNITATTSTTIKTKDGYSYVSTCDTPYPTPELATIAFVGIGLIGLVALGRRRT
ncbi:MAG: hypothetical protein J7J06_04125 [Methanosarcinales archaeon]|nr:hypothetical protein [Methanosarcinales archaeon]